MRRDTRTRRGAVRTLALVVAAWVCPGAAAEFDAGAAWARYLAEGEYSATNDAYAALGEVDYRGKGADATACREGAATLASAVEAVPVGLALRHAALLCAEALGDEAAAEREAAVIAALTRHAVREAGGTPWRRPLRVARPEDIDAFLRIAGYEERYAYFDELRAQPYLPKVIAAVEREGAPERHLAFDWIDSLARLRSDSTLRGFPIDRLSMADRFTEAWAGDDDIASVDLRALHDAIVEDELTVRRDRLRAAASRGAPIAIQAWIELCSRQKLDGCEDGLVDALLPLAEKGHALAKAQLALMHLRGVGVARDEAAARGLLDAADRAWEHAGGSVYLAAVHRAGGDAWPGWLEGRLQAAATAGAVDAAILLATARATKAPKSIPAADRDLLSSPAANAAGAGFAALADAADAAKSADAPGLREQAAAAGHAASLRQRALEVLESTPGDASAIERLKRAATGGDLIAARRLAYDAMLAGRARDSQLYLLANVLQGDVTSMLLLAGLYADEPEGIEQGAKDAVELFGLLAADVPQARRQLAMMLADGRGAAKDPVRARSLLQQDAADHESLALLGALVVTGRLDGGEQAGFEILDRASVSKMPEVLSSHGLLLVQHGDTAAQRARGLAMMREAHEAGLAEATNNVAWSLCVSPHADLRDPAAGVAMAAKLGAPEQLDSGEIDTVAACAAAAGRRDEAVRLQSLALERLPRTEAHAATRERMGERLSLYRRGGRYIEVEPASD